MCTKKPKKKNKFDDTHTKKKQWKFEIGDYVYFYKDDDRGTVAMKDHVFPLIGRINDLELFGERPVWTELTWEVAVDSPYKTPHLVTCVTHNRWYLYLCLGLHFSFGFMVLNF